MKNNLIYDVKDKPPFGKNLCFALQQFLSIIAATILVPVVADKTGVYLSQSSALIGAGVGTLIYLFLTQFKSPVFLGSSFSFVTPLATACAFGYFGIILGAIFSACVYVLLAILVKIIGVNWINKIMPPVVIGPTVALIGFDLSASAIENLTSGIGTDYSLLSILIGLITFFAVCLISVKSKKFKMYPFIAGIIIGYIISLVFTGIGYLADLESLKLIDFSKFAKVTDFDNWIPNLTFIGAIKEGFAKFNGFGDVITIFVAFVPISLAAFAEHIADHKNISSIIGKDLLKDPGLNRTLLGDGLGSLGGAVFGGCPNTTYGESIGCVALSKNASTYTILTTSIMCVIVAFFYPAILFVETIPSCVIGGICVSLYGFISVSGLRMIKEVDLNEEKNLFVVSAIFITGIGRLELKFGSIVVSNIATALIIGIILNLLLNTKSRKEKISTKGDLLESKESVEETPNENLNNNDITEKNNIEKYDAEKDDIKK